MNSTLTNSADPNQKYVKTKSLVLYLIGIFFYNNMTGMVGSYRNAYLVNVLRLEEEQTALFNTLTSIICFVLNFFIVMYIDGRKMGKGGKFKPLALLTAVPMGILLILSFWAPPGIASSTLFIYVVTVAVLWGVVCNFGNRVNMISNVITPNNK